MSIHRGTPLIINGRYLGVYIGVVTNAWSTSIRIYQTELAHSSRAGFMDYNTESTKFALMDGRTLFDYENMVILNWWEIIAPNITIVNDARVYFHRDTNTDKTMEQNVESVRRILAHWANYRDEHNRLEKEYVEGKDVEPDIL